MTITIEVLGPLRVTVDGVDRTPAGRLQAGLVALLAARAGETVADDACCEALWPGDREARTKLQLLVHRTRAVLGEDRIARTGGGYALRVSGDELDTDRFESLAVRGAYRDALALWRGVPFAEQVGVEFEHEREWWTERCRTVHVAALERELHGDEPGAVVPELRALAAERPLDEQVAALLVTALARCGRTDDALTAYERLRASLSEELGLDPGPAVRELHRRILNGEDPTGEDPGVEAQIPMQLPAGGRVLYGREADLDALDRARADAADSPFVAVITGMGGVGKTALALRWARAHREEYPDGILHAALHGFGEEPPVPPEHVLAGFLRTLGHPAAPPDDLDELVARYRSLTAGRRMLVVLDDARDAEQVLPLLTGSADGAVIVTSRESLDRLVVEADAIPVRLDPLPLALAAGMLRELADPDACSEADALALAARCGGLPLALRIVAQQIRGRGVGAGVVLTELAEHGERLALAADGSRSVRAVLASSVDALDEGERRLFGLLGVVPEHPVSAPAAAALADIELRRARRGLARLRAAHLVDELPNGRFAMHDLLREYAAALGRDNVDAAEARQRFLRFFVGGVEAANRRLGGLYGTPDVPGANGAAGHPASGGPDPDGFADARQATAWLETERPLLVELCTQELPDDEGLRVELMLHFRSHLTMFGLRHERRRVADAMLDLAERSGDRQLERIALRTQALLRMTAGRLDEARAFLERSLRILEDGDERGTAIALNNLGECALFTGDPAGAADAYRRALAVNRRRGDAERVVLNLANLAIALDEAGDESGADRAIAEALSTPAPLRGVTTAEALSAQILERRGRIRDAFAATERALAASDGLRDIESRLWAMIVRGRCLTALGDPAAEAAIRGTVASARRRDYIPQLCEALEALAELLTERDPDAARDAMGEAAALRRRGFVRRRWG